MTTYDHDIAQWTTHCAILRDVRRTTGLTAAQMRHVASSDHDTIDNFDLAARTLSNRYPGWFDAPTDDNDYLGRDGDSDRLWRFLLAGQTQRPRL